MAWRFGFLHQMMMRPTWTVVGSFVLVALIGSLLLTLPMASTGAPVPWVDAFFTATSAVCVTGLVVVDTGTRFTPFGQAVILALFQLGGLGIMTLSLILITLSGRRISLSGRSIMEQTFMPNPGAHIYSVTMTIIVFTFLIEGVGALLLYAAAPVDGLFSAVFHAVSAFCNAGFALRAESFTAFRANPAVNGIITSLIIAGGLGFFVVFECFQFFVQRSRKKLSLHTKTVLSVTAGLLVIGTLLFFFFEYNNLLRGMPLGEKILASFFQSVTSRTAGFNTVDFGLATNPTLLMVIMLMFIGASPGSTGGGIKTTCLGVLIALAKSKLHGREDVSLFKASFSNRAVARALSVTILAIVIISGALLVLLWTETGNQPFSGPHPTFIQYFFETVSAFGTVGLSTGITGGLSAIGKLLLTLVMFIGRIGPLTLAYAVGRRYGRGKFRYAEESIMIG